MKRIYLALFTCFLILGTCVHVQAQSKDDQKKQLWDEIKTKRASFFTQRIGLTPAEAQAFWPVYDELQDKKGQLHYKMSLKFRDFGKKEFDFDKANEDFINSKFQEAMLEKLAYLKLKVILNPEKLFKYYAAERDWANQLLKDIQNRGPR